MPLTPLYTPEGASCQRRGGVSYGWPAFRDPAILRAKRIFSKIAQIDSVNAIRTKLHPLSHGTCIRWQLKTLCARVDRINYFICLRHLFTSMKLSVLNNFFQIHTCALIITIFYGYQAILPPPPPNSFKGKVGFVSPTN